MAAFTVDKSINMDNVYSMSGGNPCFVALAGNTTYQTNPTGYSTWVTATITPNTTWQSVCYGNNILVAISNAASSNIVSTSPAGVTATWTQHALPTSANWFQVAYGNSTFVATTTGLGSATNAVAYSPDGATWTSTNASVSGNWKALCYGAKFVALSASSTNAMYSTDGISWTTASALPASRVWSSVCYGTPTVSGTPTPTYVAVATGPTNKGAYSTDGGSTWTEMTMPSSSNWVSVTYGNGTFAAITSATTVAAYSTDGINWTASTLSASATWAAVAYGNGVFTAVSTSSANGSFSYDGIHWQALTLLSQAATCICYCPTTWNSNDTLTIANNATVTVNTDQSKFWSAITITEGNLVISNSSTSTGIRFTMGRVTGAAAATITPSSGVGNTQISGSWISLGTGSGSSGQTMTAPFSDYIPALWVENASGSGVYDVWLNATGDYGDSSTQLLDGLAAVSSGARGKFFIQQANSAPYGPTIITATAASNGAVGSLAQKLVTISSATGLYPGASVFGPGIPANTVVNRIVSSTLLELNASTTTEMSPDWLSVCYGNSTYVAVSGTNSNIAATSSDGTTWTKRALPFVANWTSVCYGSTSALFVAVCSDGAIGSFFCATSADGITWTKRAMPTNNNWNSVASNGTSYVAVGATAAGAATTAAASSVDGLTWVAATMATSLVWNAVAFGGARYVAVGTAGTVCNYDADGAGTWTAGATMTSATYVALTYNGTIWMAISGNSTGNQNKADPTTGAFAAGGALPNSTSTGVAWDGTNFVVVSTTNSTQTARSTNGTAWTTTTLTGTQIGSWSAVCANGSTLVAVSRSSLLRSYAMTSTNSGTAWTVRTGMPTDVSLTCYNPYVSQLSSTIQFGDGVNGNKVPTGANVRCPNIMFTSAVPANIQTSSRLVGANFVMTAGGSLLADKCLFDESYSNFDQTDVLELTNCAFSLPPIISECYALTINSVGFALEPVRRYYTASATVGSDGWITRDSRYGNSSTNIWNYISGASITDLSMAVGQPLGLQAAQSGGTVAVPTPVLTVNNIQNSTWSNIRFFGLNINHNFQVAFYATALFNNNIINYFEAYGLSTLFLGTSSGNTITNITYSEDMFNGYKNMVNLTRIGDNPVTGAKLTDDTKYYIKNRSFRDWTDRTQYYEGRVVSATPFLGSTWFPQSLSVYNSGNRAVTITWVRRDPEASSLVVYTLFRGTSSSFTRNSASRIFSTATVATVSFVDQFVATATRSVTFAQAGRTITATTGSFVTDGFIVGMNVIVTGSASNNGTYMILTVTALVITLTTNHTNLVNETVSATLNGPTVSNATTYYYRLQKYDSILSGITNAAGTGGQTTLTIPSGSFNTGLGSIANCQGISGQNKIRLPVGNTTANFLSGNVSPGMQIAGTGVGSGATVTSIDTPWQITVSVVNSSTFTGQTLTLGACSGLYIYGPGIAWPTKVSSVDTSQQITVDTAFLKTFSASTINFLYGTESDEFECYVNGATTAAFNFLSFSDDFSNAVWTKTNMTVTVNTATGPNDIPFSNNGAVLTGDRLVSTGPNGKAVQNITYLKSGASYTFSVYVMTNPSAHQQSVAGQISIDTSTPTTQTFTANGAWQRVSANFTATSTTHNFTIQINTDGSYIYAATAMVNAGSTALAPVATAAAIHTTVASGGRTLSFVAYSSTGATNNSITCSSGSFVTDGYAAGDTIVVSGSTSNDGTYVLSAVAAATLTLILSNTLTAEGPNSSGSIVGSVLPAAAQELTGAAVWSRSTGGDGHNQGIELSIPAAPTGTHYTEIYLGTASNFTPSNANRVGYVLMPGSPAPFSYVSSNNNKVDTVTQVGGGLSGALITLTGSSNNLFLNFDVDYNFAINTASVLNVQNFSDTNTFDNFTITGWRNYIANWTPFTFLNNASGVLISNMTFDTYDFPFYITTTNSASGIIMKGVSGGNSSPITSATTYLLGTTTDGIGISFQTIYDSMFHEMYYGPTIGALVYRFNASQSETPPYSIVSGNPQFANLGRLYFTNAGDSMEIVWPYKIYGVSGFRDITFKKDGLDLGTNNDFLESLLVEYAIDTGSGYGAYQTAAPATLASETVSTTTGFNFKIRLTARAGMKYTGQATNFVINETITGATSGATAVVLEDYDLGTTGTLILGSVSGTFFPGESIKSGATARATNLATNTQFALFPSFNSYIDGLEIFTNTVSPGDYAGQSVNIILTNVVIGSEYFVFKTSDQTLLGIGTATDTTVTISNVGYISDFGITVRVRKASTAPKYIPLETQATVNSAGVSVYIGQTADTIAT